MKCFVVGKAVTGTSPLGQAVMAKLNDAQAQAGKAIEDYKAKAVAKVDELKSQASAKMGKAPVETKAE